MEKGFSHLLNLISKRGLSQSSVADTVGVTAQALQGWRATNEIPTKRVSQIADALDLGKDDIDLLLGNDPLKIQFRTPKGDVSAEEASLETKLRSETLFERFYAQPLAPITYDFTELRKKFDSIGNDFRKIAEAIREEFVIASYQPLTREQLNKILRRMHVVSYLMPFQKLGLCNGDSIHQTGAVFAKDGGYAILLDSDRRLDEAHFDCVHEIVHICLGPLNFNLKTAELETLIDKISGELIYPYTYIVDTYFGGDPNSRPTFEIKVFAGLFIKEYFEFQRIFSPRGLALALFDSGIRAEKSDWYKTLYGPLHEKHKAQVESVSKFGEIDFDFSDVEKLADFYRAKVIKEDGRVNYPLFAKLRDDLLSDHLAAADFADTFGLRRAEALWLKTTWAQAAVDDSAV